MKNITGHDLDPAMFIQTVWSPTECNQGAPWFAGVEGDTALSAFFGFNETHRPLGQSQMGIWHLEYQDIMHTDGVWCVTAQPSLGEVLQENHTLTPNYLAPGMSWNY